MTTRFTRYDLRTTDVPAAKAFYSDLFGRDFWGDEISISPLPPQAISRGARPHWLGHLGVPDLSDRSAEFVTLGAQRLGPILSRNGHSYNVLRDPFGAVVAFTTEMTPPLRSRVMAHILHSCDHEKAFATYATLFGWVAKDRTDLGPEHGVHQGFAFDATGARAGSVSNAALSPQIHPQWLFFFRVSDLAQAVARVRERGGIALETMRTPNGDLVAPCDDPEGAAFALFQPRGPN